MITHINIFDGKDSVVLIDKDVILKEYSYLPHGFLNYNAPLLGLKEESTEAIK